MENKSQGKSQVITREKVFLAAIIPQSILLLVSILWINFFPKDNILQFLKIDFISVLSGALTGIGLAVAGYGFYRYSKKSKYFYSTVELFEKLLAPAFKNLKVIDIFVLSIVSSFIEETFFRGLLLPKVGIIMSGLAFGLLHLPGTKYWVYMLWATISGIILGYLFVTTNSLWCPITAHIVNNIIGMFMLKKLSKQ